MSKTPKKTIIFIIFLIGTIFLTGVSLQKLFNNNLILQNIVVYTKNNIISNFYTPSGKIPVYEINISKQNYKELISNLPKSGKIYQKGEITFPDKETQKVELRFRGDNKWHWDYPKKSWRVKLETPNNNEKILNFINPRHKNQITFHLGYYLAEKAGIPRPDYGFIALYINGKYSGFYDHIEQIDQRFLQNHKMEPGDIFYGEPDDLSKIKDNYFGIFADTEYWEYHPRKNNNKENAYNQLNSLLHLTRSEIDAEALEKLSQILDIEKTLKFIAILDLFQSPHIDNFHNLKIYLNPETNKFEPIAWDLLITVRLDTVNSQISSTNNLLFNKLMMIPELSEQKNRYLYKYISSFAQPEKILNFIDQEANNIDHELYYDPIKDYWATEKMVRPKPVLSLSYNEWIKSIEELKKCYEIRHNNLIKTFDNTEITIKTKKFTNNTLLSIDILGEIPFQVENYEKLSGQIIYPHYETQEKLDVIDRTEHRLKPIKTSYDFLLSEKEAAQLPEKIMLKNTITGNIKEIAIDHEN